MSASIKVEINPGIVDHELACLRSMLSDCESNRSFILQLDSKGKTIEAMQEGLTEGYGAVFSSLVVLLQSTITFLENCRDGFLDADSQ